MSQEFIMHLILDSLNLDDESIELLLDEIKIDRSFSERLKLNYRTAKIDKKSLFSAINELIKKELVDVYDSAGKGANKFHEDLKVEKLNLKNSWLHITESGAKWYHDYYYRFWLD